MSHANIGKVLRVGVIYKGKILDEQIFRKPETVYVGDTAKAHFTIPSSSLPSKFPVFYYKSGKYELVIMENMTGKIFLKGKVIIVEDVVKKGILKKRGKAYILPLASDARGKLVVGSAVILFQFITPPPKPPKLKLPRSIRGSWTQRIDWTYATTQIVVYILGYIWIMWLMSLPKPAPTTLDQIPDRFAKVLGVEKLKDEHKEKAKLPKNGKGEKKVKIAKKSTSKKVDKKESSAGKKTRKKPRDAATRAKEEAIRTAEMKKKVAGMGLLKLIGSKGSKGGGGIISDVLGDGGKDKDIDSALAGVKHIGIATNSSQRSRKGDVGAVKTAKIGNLKVAKSSGKLAVSARHEKKIVASASIGAPDVDGVVDQASISRVVKRHRRAIRRCYEKALKTNPNLRGKIAVTFMITERGRTDMIEISQDTMHEPKVASCIKAVIRRWRFPKPENGSASVTFPFVFAPSN